MTAALTHERVKVAAMSAQAELVEDMSQDAEDEAVPAKRARDAPQSLLLLTHRQLIGYLGLSLPLGVYVLAGFVPTEGLVTWQPLPSVSAYYYSGAGDFFVGVLFAMALFLITYPGYQGVLKDRLLALTAGVAALGVALFPTEAPEGLREASSWRPLLGTMHLVCAVVLFSSFALFALWLFRLSDIPRWRDRDTEKDDCDHGLCTGLVGKGRGKVIGHERRASCGARRAALARAGRSLRRGGLYASSASTMPPLLPNLVMVSRPKPFCSTVRWTSASRTSCGKL